MVGNTFSTTYPVSFSDSIILFTSDDTDNSVFDIVINTATILAAALSNKIPMKGAIAFGEMTVDKDKSLYFGKPLIDAYELHQELRMYGLVLHHTAQTHFEQLRNNNKSSLASAIESLLWDYHVPLEFGAVTHKCLDWTFFCEDPINCINKLYDEVSGKPRKYVDNTLEFVNWLDEEKKKFEKKKAKDIRI